MVLHGFAWLCMVLHGFAPLKLLLFYFFVALKRMQFQCKRGKKRMGE
jgi:hypothetical protein